MKQNHLDRLRERKCSVLAGTEFLNLLSDIERISDICSNVGVSTVMRINPAKGANVHEYISFLHSGRDEEFNTRYQQLHDDYFSRLDALQKNA